MLQLGYVLLLNQRRYKDGYMNPGSIACAGDGNFSCAQAQSSYTPKVMIRNSTMTQLYPVQIDEATNDTWIETNIVAPFTISGYVTQMFSTSDMRARPVVAAQVAGNRFLVNLCMGQDLIQLDSSSNYTDNAGVVRQINGYRLRLLRNDFPVIYIENKTDICDQNVVKNCPGSGFSTYQYTKWYDCVQSTYRQYWRPYFDDYTGFKRGERIIASVSAVFTFTNDQANNQDVYNQMKSLIDGGIIELNNKEQLDQLLQNVARFNINDTATYPAAGQSFNVTVSATVYHDYDIGLDTWTIVVTVILAVISVWFIVTIKCIPKAGKKIYKCCPSLFEIEDTSKVLQSIEEAPKTDLVVAQGEDNKLDGLQESQVAETKEMQQAASL